MSATTSETCHADGLHFSNVFDSLIGNYLFFLVIKIFEEIYNSNQIIYGSLNSFVEILNLFNEF